jgi:hypothetical protein
MRPRTVVTCAPHLSIDVELHRDRLAPLIEFHTVAPETAGWSSGAETIELVSPHGW